MRQRLVQAIPKNAGSVSDIMRVRTIRNIVERFRTNGNGYVHRHRLFLVLTVPAFLADATPDANDERRAAA
ncbi:MAG: hypothetical protein JSW66_06135 [Phycisphaerales bacterium]|nr:MAG: hypothetical protein JSW66_06135 [Phycisphaerales bacterium]